MPNVTEKVTQKLGPLPVWAWAGVVAGGYLIAKRLGGGGGGNDVSAGNPQLVGGAGGTPLSGGSDIITDDAGIVERLSHLESQQNAIPGLSEAVSNNTLLNTLLAKLAGFQQQYAKALADQEHWRTVYRTSTGAKKANAAKERDAAAARAATALKGITTTQAEIKKVGT